MGCRHVNLRALLAVVLLACQVGRPPASGRYTVGTVRAAVPEPGLPDALASGLAAGLARHGALGSGPEVQLTVLTAVESVRAAGATRIHAVELRLEAVVPGPRPRRLVWSGTRDYGAGGVDPVADAEARARAWRRLSARAGDEIASWVLYASTEPG